MNLRVTHNFTPNVAGRGGRGGPGGGGGGRGFGGAGRGGRGAQQGTSVSMTAQVQYRRNDNDQTNVFPSLGGTNTGSSLAIPVTLNIVHKRILHNVTVNFSRTQSSAFNNFAFVNNVTGDAGIAGVSTDPFDWGLPQLSFSSLSSLHDVTPSRRTDSRLSMGYGWTRPSQKHTLRAGADVRFDNTISQTDPNANGAFVFTGLYASGGASTIHGGGLDFADFLLGFPQQASLQYGPGNEKLHGKSINLYLQDDWRRTSSLTFNLGVRYELLWPYVERNGRMVNLDVNSNFTAAVPVLSGQTGPFSGRVPQRTCRSRREQRRPARRLRMADQAWNHPARRLRRELQLGHLLDDRPPAGRPAAVRGNQHQHRGRRSPSDLQRPVHRGAAR